MSNGYVHVIAMFFEAIETNTALTDKQELLHSYRHPGRLFLVLAHGFSVQVLIETNLGWVSSLHGIQELSIYVYTQVGGIFITLSLLHGQRLQARQHGETIFHFYRWHVTQLGAKLSNNVWFETI